MRKRRFLIALVFALGVLLVPVMAYAEAGDVSPVNPYGKEVVIIKAYDVEAVIAKGQHLKLDASIGAGASGSVTWSSSDNSVAAVDSNGEVVGGADGTAIITAECGGFTDTLKVTVKTPKYVVAKVDGEDATEYQYNSFGQVTREVSEYGTEETTYNDYGLPVEVRQIDGFGTDRTTYQYDDLMNLISAVYDGGSGNKITYEYDSFGRLTAYEERNLKTDKLNESATYEYSSSDGGLTMTETWTDYPLNEPPETEVTVWTYNAKGLLTREEEDSVDEGKLITTYSYDKKDRLKKTKDLWSNETTKYTYNKKGLLKKTVTAPYTPDSVKYAKCVVKYTYDAQRRDVKSIEKYGPFKNVSVKMYAGKQDIPNKMINKYYKKSGKKYRVKDKETITQVVTNL